jgi:hypothetical protein
VSRQAHIYADEHLAYDELCGLDPLTRVNHWEAYQQGLGVSTNIILPRSAFMRAVHHRRRERCEVPVHAHRNPTGEHG